MSKQLACLVGAVTAVAALTLSACSSSGGNTNATIPPASVTGSSAVNGASHAGSNATVSVAGGALTASDGHTLYVNTKDTAGSVTCTGGCASLWPPLAGPVTAGGGVDATKLATVSRPDGSLQATYDGKPLYEFSGDKASGDRKGDGMDDSGGTWHVATVASAPATSSPTVMPSSDMSSGGGYTY